MNHYDCCAYMDFLYFQTMPLIRYLCHTHTHTPTQRCIGMMITHGVYIAVAPMINET